jgi:hypothetical protein
MEILLRKIPNDYEYKRSYLDKHSNDLNTLILGSSHSYYGINPQYIKDKCFNAAYISQSLDYDWELLKRYDGRWHNLKAIILPIDYASFYIDLDQTPEAWRAKDYNIYFDININASLSSNSEVLSNKLRLNIGRIHSNYVLHEPNALCSMLGWGIEYHSQTKEYLVKTGKIAAKRHSIGNTNDITKNLMILESIINYTHRHKIKVLLYTSPAYKTYVENLNRNKLNTIITTLQKLAEKNSNVYYCNLLSNDSFTAGDFYDADHLDVTGAKKLTRKIDSLLKVIEK